MDGSRKDEAVKQLCEYCSSDQVEEQAESGEWWLHCHKCGMDNAIEKENEMENTFKPGDVVMLKSGGPVMTIEEVVNKSKLVPSEEPGVMVTTQKIPGKFDIACVWFNKTNNVDRGTFSQASLKEPTSEYLSHWKGQWK